MEELVGQTLNRYKIISLLGEGGMGAVFKAHDITLQRDVAIKVMHTHFAKLPNFQERFLQEARTAARLDHSNIVQVHDFGQDRSHLYIVMKYIPGDNLEKMLRDMRSDNKWILLGESAGLIQQVASALDYAHRQGVLHRDIKPGNIMIEPEASDGLPYRPIITDLGLAKLAEGGIVTQDGTSMGTPAYMSPEQALGETTDGRSDVYSLGVLLFELATGQLPFPARNLADAIQFHVNTSPPRPISLRPDVPVELDHIILRCMEKDPKKRFQTAAALSQALKDASKLTHNVHSVPSPLQGAVSLFTQYQQSLVEKRGVSILEEFSVPSELHQDRIQILAKDKTTRSVQAKKPVMMFGRDPDNDIVLDDQKSSRHHIRLEFDGKNYQVIDLNSTNGTFLANQRLVPGVSEIWLPEKALRIGDTWFRLMLADQDSLALPGMTVRQPMEAAETNPVILDTRQDRLALFLDANQISIEPGQTFNIPINLRNQDTAADTYSITIAGIPPNWINPPARPISLAPGEQKQVFLTLSPPREPKTRAGRYPLTIHITGQKHPADFIETSLTLTMLAYSQFTSRLSPERLSGGEMGRISIRNQGNSPESYSISWQDPSRELSFSPSHPRFNVPEGQEVQTEFRVEKSKRPLFGGDKINYFAAQISASSGETKTHQAEVKLKALLPIWLIPVFLMACLLVGAAGVFVVSSFGGNSSPTRTAQAANTEVALAVQQTNEAGTATALMVQNVGQSTLDAATATANWLSSDNDKDGLTNSEELTLNTLPEKRDTDEDGLDDGEEVNNRKTDPLKPDSDADGIKDGEEVARAMNPLDPDSDKDGIPDPQDPAPIQTSTVTLDLPATQQAANQSTQQYAASQTAAAQQATAQMAAQLTAVAAQTASAAHAATMTAEAIRRIAYIYTTDLTAANDFKTYLETQGYIVDLISQADIFSIDFGIYKAILIGYETGSISTWADDPGSTAGQLQATGKPILGVGEGGYAFFGKLGLTIGWGNGAHGTAKDIHILDTGEHYWNDPQNISIPGNNIISLYEIDGSYVGIYYPSPIAGVERVANITTDANYYPLIRESDRYFLWGFDGTPSAMTVKGQKVLVNVLDTLIP